MEKSKEEFINSIKKVKGFRKHKITNSIGTYDAYKWLRHNKWLDIERPITEHDFYTIIREVGKLIAEELSKGNNIILPKRMGELELRKYESIIMFKNGKIKTNLPIDWNKTLILWEENKEAYKKKKLIRQESKEIFKVYYNKSKANYNNKIFFDFNINRELKIKLKDNIKEGNIDAFLLK